MRSHSETGKLISTFMLHLNDELLETSTTALLNIFCKKYLLVIFVILCSGIHTHTVSKFKH